MGRHEHGHGQGNGYELGKQPSLTNYRGVAITEGDALCKLSRRGAGLQQVGSSPSFLLAEMKTSKIASFSLL